MKQGLELKRLFEICDIKTGKKDVNQGNPNGQYPFFTCAKEHGFSDTYSFDTEALLIAGNGDVGNVSYFSGKFEAYQRTYVLYNFRAVLPRFLFLLLEGTLKKYLSDKTLGNTIPYIKLGVLRDFEFPLPPLHEQQLIVSILDECFKAIDEAKTNTERNLKNAKELFDSYLQEVFENGNWETKTIKEISKVVNGYAFASKDFKPTNRVKSVKITNVGVKEFVEEADNYLPEKFKETLKDFQVKSGNIVIALTRTIISAGLKVAIVPASYDGALVNQRVAALVPNEKLANQNFLYYFLTTIGVAKYVLANVNTLMQPNLSINALRNLRVPCPPLKEQQTIVHHFDALRAETLKLEAVYQKKLSNLDELKKSILQKAFAGELTTDEAIAV